MAPVVTLEQLTKIVTKCPVLRAAALHPHLVKAMGEFEIHTPLRAAAFLAQIAHESGHMRWMTELWGPTPQQLKYEPPGKLAERLGNTETGDGYRFRGRGVIQLTGRANYRAAGAALGVDLENNPDSASSGEMVFRTAGWFWSSRALNALADAGNFDAITKKINGGYNGKEDRDRLYALAKTVLGVSQK